MNNTAYLAHYGIKVMKWGVRRYENADGSLTPAGKKRYSNFVKSQAFNHMSASQVNDYFNRNR